MIFENMKNKKYVRRILLLFLLVAFMLTSSLVHAQDTETFIFTKESTDETGAYLAPMIIPEENDTAVYIDTLEDICVPSQEAPLVQELSMTARSTSALYQENDYDSFYENSVFVGDSLSVGFEAFCSQYSDTIASDTTYFLARQSGSSKAAVSSNALTKHAKIMPQYNGKTQLIEDSISQMPDIEKVFICFGMNDLVGSTPKQFVRDFETLVDRILSKSPDVSIYVLSIPCVVDSVQTGSLSNASIRSANELLAKACLENQWGFINTAEYLMGSDLSIREEYSSDGYVHENNSAYREWNKVLRNYAYSSSAL